VRAVTVDGTAYVQLIAYNARAQRILIVRGNGVMTRYAYDPDAFRVTRLRTEHVRQSGDVLAAIGTALQDLTYLYDLVGNLTSTEERTVGCGVAKSEQGRDRLVRTFAYDPIYRLISATGRACVGTGQARPPDDVAACGHNLPFSPGHTTPNQANAPDFTEYYTETYCYDPVGNLLDLVYQAPSGSWHRLFGVGGRPPTACDGPLTVWSSAANNRLTSVRTGSRTDSLHYDDAGNLEHENADRHYKWDRAGRMIGFQIKAGGPPSKAARYLYGTDGIRVKKWVRYGNSPSLDESTVYIDQYVEHHRWVKSGGGEQTLVHIHDNTGRVALVRTGDTHPDDKGPAIRFELPDHLGSIAVTTDETGQWVNREEFFPYGETSLGSFSRKRYRFTGKERDEESGLSLHGARYYVPWLLRWLNPDPAGLRGGPNPYGYCYGRPTCLVDDTGAFPIALVLLALLLVSFKHDEPGGSDIRPIMAAHPALAPLAAFSYGLESGGQFAQAHSADAELKRVAAQGNQGPASEKQLQSLATQKQESLSAGGRALFAGAIVVATAPESTPSTPRPPGSGPTAPAPPGQSPVTIQRLVPLEQTSGPKSGTLGGYVTTENISGPNFATTAGRLDVATPSAIAPRYAQGGVVMEAKTPASNLGPPDPFKPSDLGVYRSGVPEPGMSAAQPPYSPVPEYKLSKPVPIPDQPTRPFLHGPATPKWVGGPTAEPGTWTSTPDKPVPVFNF
jgi:RHS repeat-associated protein